MPLYQFKCDGCEAEFEAFHSSATIGKAVLKCEACGENKASRVFQGSRSFGMIPNLLDGDKHMCVRIDSDRWPKDKYGRPVVSSRSEERAVLRQVAAESQGRSCPISPYDH
jgi:putative FmdB family regulatory protein